MKAMGWHRRHRRWSDALEVFVWWVLVALIAVMLIGVFEVAFPDLFWRYGR